MKLMNKLLAVALVVAAMPAMTRAQDQPAQQRAPNHGGIMEIKSTGTALTAFGDAPGSYVLQE